MKKYPEPYLYRGYYYFTYRDPKTGKRITKSTGKPKGEKEKARRWIRTFIDDLYSRTTELTFRQYSEPFFIWGSCPRVKRRQNEGKSIGRTHVEKSRSWLERYVLNDSFADMKLSEIRRGDILELRERVKSAAGINTVNKVISTVKTIFSEAFYREDLDRNPGLGIGNINYEKEESGVFSSAEIRELFKECPGPWDDVRTYTVFMTAAFTGMRSGEILALMWDKVHLDDQVFEIHRAWKDTKEIGPPKWGKLRDIPVSAKVTEAIEEHQSASVQLLPSDLIFCWEDGVRLGETWWRKSFRNAMINAGFMLKIDATKEVLNPRNVTPHALRHSLNTNLIAAGCDPYKVQAYLGWSPNIQVPVLTRVQEGYTHMNADHLRDIVDSVDKLYLSAD